MKTNRSCIIIFAKAPIAGHVKTRLSKNLDTALVIGLYRNFVKDMADKITGADLCLKIFYDPPGSVPLMRKWLGSHHDFYLQQGNDLGEKMAHAFQTTFEKGFRHIVLMGTDFPDLPARIIRDALTALRGHDAVIGPAIDGGYYLIGFSSTSYIPKVFNDIAWGTAHVYDKTMNVLQAANAYVHLLPKWRDVDEDVDLKDLIQSLKDQPDQAPHTHKFLKYIGMIEN